MKQTRYAAIASLIIIGISVSSLYLIPHFAVATRERGMIDKALDTSRFEYDTQILSVSDKRAIWITDKVQLAQILTEGKPENATYIPQTEPTSDILLNNIKNELENLVNFKIIPDEDYQFNGSPIPFLYTDKENDSVLIWNVTFISSRGSTVELVFHSATGRYVSLQYVDKSVVHEITSNYCVNFSQYWGGDVWLRNVVPCRNDCNAPLIFSLDLIENGYALKMFYEK